MHPGRMQWQNPSLQTPANSHAELVTSTSGVPRPGPMPNPGGIQLSRQLGSHFGDASQMNLAADMANKPPYGPMGGFGDAGPRGVAANVANMRGSMDDIGYPPPLEKPKFDALLSVFLQEKGIKLDPDILTLDDRRIDLALLHALVIKEGGFQEVNVREIWNVIGGRMGFVNFPESDREPPNSGPVVAQHLAHVYREYLLDFEQVYLRTWLASNPVMKMDPGGMQPGSAGPYPGAPGGAGGPGGMANGLAGLPPGQLRGMGPILVEYANLTTLELRQRGISEELIALVEHHFLDVMKEHAKN
ncbi:hypothetical protein NP233_g1972 [Leucocoprinus birnbaumii]|uniref:ARID domain-containing protein n=1 Tax=Leucocoprinus birnbaumii TaxID=56174 RepID=A0AAD5W159_9AGAR|nr:hypothetical protein NP233_g1972 [Leucocoprinus birnbaumii]